ncbi:hypothetical protein ES332_A06G043800v1 [Gossypium tomentosum]|uniref:Uncharacterized protein n=1 Tax=Gossypium tomentosum TaxID=34277 RepID=A0A5D2Q2B8_GOSTO|nr:hypothetical protein ES332_A06G043800v1 [Gossypium tomentosum]
MSEPYFENMKEDTGVYYGVLKISGKEISSTFLPFKDEEKALELYTHLVEHHDNWILSCHHLVRYQDEWLVGLEYSKNIVTYFREKMEVWESSDRNQHEWFNYISEDFVKILKDIACFGLKGVKFLPNLNVSGQPIEGDIDELKYLMNYIVNMPFGSIIQNYENFNMPNELSFPVFLLDVPLFWRPVDKFHFIINLDHMMKRGEIMQGFIDRCLFLLRKKYSYKWMSVVKCDPVLKSVLEHPESHYPTNSLSSVVQYSSNVYLHYNDNITVEISIINIESELSTLLPELYLHLFEGLINYAISNKSRHPVFSKSIISENI